MFAAVLLLALHHGTPPQGPPVDLRGKAAPAVAVLLHEFVERFDRTFLPVARVTVP